MSAVVAQKQQSDLESPTRSSSPLPAYINCYCNDDSQCPRLVTASSSSLSIESHSSSNATADQQPIVDYLLKLAPNELVAETTVVIMIVFMALFAAYQFKCARFDKKKKKTHPLTDALTDIEASVTGGCAGGSCGGCTCSSGVKCQVSSSASVSSANTGSNTSTSTSLLLSTCSSLESANKYQQAQQKQQQQHRLLSSASGAGGVHSHLKSVHLEPLVAPSSLSSSSSSCALSLSKPLVHLQHLTQLPEIAAAAAAMSSQQQQQPSSSNTQSLLLANSLMSALASTGTTNSHRLQKTTTASSSSGSRSNNSSSGVVEAAMAEWSGSGSGAGVPQCVQRTIHPARQIKLSYPCIGKGRFGEVYKGEWRGEHVAVKTFNSFDEKSWENECAIFNTTGFRHVNILGFIAADNIDRGTYTELWLITEFHENGSLYDFLNARPLSVELLLKQTLSIVNGLVHLHMPIESCKGKPALAHCDLKTKNILVKADLTCCISDLGLALAGDKDGRIELASCGGAIRTGTKRYMAPEILAKRIDARYLDAFQKAEMYSLALVFWEMLMRCEVSGVSCDPVCGEYRPPYYEYIAISDPDEALMHSIVCEQKRRPAWLDALRTNAFTDELVQLTAKLWVESPSERLDALRLKESITQLATNHEASTTIAANIAASLLAAEHIKAEATAYRAKQKKKAKAYVAKIITEAKMEKAKAISEANQIKLDAYKFGLICSTERTKIINEVNAMRLDAYKDSEKIRSDAHKILNSAYAYSDAAKILAKRRGDAKTKDKYE